MRILQVAAKPHRRGAEVFACQLSDWLEREGHEVLTVYLYHHFGSDSLTPSTPNTNAVAEHKSLLEKLPGFNPRLVHYLYRCLELFRPDVVQVNGGRCLKYGALARRLIRKDFALVYRSIGSPGFWKRNFLGQKIANWITMQADAIVAVSDATLQEFGPSPGAQERRRIHRGTDFSSLRKSTPMNRAHLDTPLDAKVLLYIGSLSFEKCPQRAIEVLARLHKQGENVHLWMLGDGPESEKCRALATELGIVDRIRLAGTVQEVAPYILSADLHLLTSDTEGLPGCIVECSALGLPSIAADVGGVREIVRDNRTGFVVEPSNIDTYVERASILLNDDDIRAQFAEQAKGWAESFSMDKIGPQYLELYRDLLAQEKP